MSRDGDAKRSKTDGLLNENVIHLIMKYWKTPYLVPRINQGNKFFS
jgi:hypothetical protein